MFGGRALCTFALAALAMGGCAQKRTQPAAQSAKPQPIPAAPTAAEEAAPVKQPRFGESAVYIDGKPVGVIRITELPSGLKSRQADLGGGYHRTTYGFVDYVRALGIDSKRIKQMHLYGGSRVVVVDRAELTRIGDGITFSFVAGDRGKPRVHFPPVKLHVNTTIDMLSNVAFYVEKEPPVLNPKDHELVMPDGKPVETKVPYAPEEQGNGTRVYVDGALVGVVKRKKITDDMAVKSTTADTAAAKNGAEVRSDASPDRFSLLAYAAKLRPEAKQVKAIDLVAGDDVVAHLGTESARDLTFYVPAHNRGQAVVDVPSKTGTERARISAVQIYVNSTPPTRPVVAVGDAVEATIGSGRAGPSSDDEL
jgi:hypothetical protein